MVLGIFFFFFIEIHIRSQFFYLSRVKEWERPRKSGQTYFCDTVILSAPPWSQLLSRIINPSLINVSHDRLDIYLCIYVQKAHIRRKNPQPPESSFARGSRVKPNGSKASSRFRPSNDERKKTGKLKGKKRGEKNRKIHYRRVGTVSSSSTLIRLPFSLEKKVMKKSHRTRYHPLDSLRVTVQQRGADEISRWKARAHAAVERHCDVRHVANALRTLFSLAVFFFSYFSSPSSAAFALGESCPLNTNIGSLSPYKLETFSSFQTHASGMKILSSTNEWITSRRRIHRRTVRLRNVINYATN